MLFRRDLEADLRGRVAFSYLKSRIGGILPSKWRMRSFHLAISASLAA
jgi:hypothetical protein